MRLIDADALVRDFLEDNDGFDVCIVYDTDIRHAPTIDAVPVVHARWKLNDDGSGTCENCRRTTVAAWDMDSALNYCPHCGARMDGE